MSLSLKTGVQISLLGSCEGVPLPRCLVNDRKAFGSHNGQKVMVNFYSFGVLAETLLLAISNGHMVKLRAERYHFGRKVLSALIAVSAEILSFISVPFWFWPRVKNLPRCYTIALISHSHGTIVSISSFLLMSSLPLSPGLSLSHCLVALCRL